MQPGPSKCIACACLLRRKLEGRSTHLPVKIDTTRSEGAVSRSYLMYEHNRERERERERDHLKFILGRVQINMEVVCVVVV